MRRSLVVTVAATLAACFPSRRQPSTPSPTPAEPARQKTAKEQYEAFVAAQHGQTYPVAQLPGRVGCWRGNIDYKVGGRDEVTPMETFVRRSVDDAAGRMVVDTVVFAQGSSSPYRTVLSIDLATGAATEARGEVTAVARYRRGDAATDDGGDQLTLVYEWNATNGRVANRHGELTAVIPGGKLRVIGLAYFDLAEANAAGLDPARGASAVDVFETVLRKKGNLLATGGMYGEIFEISSAECASIYASFPANMGG